MTHIPQARVVIVVPEYRWGEEVKKAYLTKIEQKLTLQEMEEFVKQARFIILAGSSISRGLLGLTSATLILVVHGWWRTVSDEERIYIRNRLEMLEHVYGVTVEYIGEDYYR